MQAEGRDVDKNVQGEVQIQELNLKRNIMFRSHNSIYVRIKGKIEAVRTLKNTKLRKLMPI